jgi:hypothetical protein
MRLPKSLLPEDGYAIDAVQSAIQKWGKTGKTNDRLLDRRGRFTSNDAADGSSAEKAIQNIETNVPPGSTHCDEAAIEVHHSVLWPA